jgi:hypothetical protein
MSENKVALALLTANTIQAVIWTREGLWADWVEPNGESPLDTGISAKISPKDSMSHETSALPRHGPRLFESAG